MTNPDPVPSPSKLRCRALSRWDNEGGALASLPNDADALVPDMTNAELVHLRGHRHPLGCVQIFA